MCNGEVVPRAPALTTIIEYTHRATSGIDLLAVVLLVVWAVRAWPRGHRVRLGAALSGLFIVTEALIGAGLVLLEHVAANPSVYRGISLSIHLVNTFTLLAVLALTAWWASGGPAAMPQPAYRGLLVVALVGLIVLGISGAIAALGDTLFPVTSLSAGLAQDFSPSAHLFVRLRVFHPGIAVVVTAFLLFAVSRAMKRASAPGLRTLGLTVMGLAFLQLVVGAMNLALLAPVWMQLVHLAVGDFLWIATVLFAFSVSGTPER